MADQVKVNASELADKWVRRLSGATEDIRRGVERVTVNPAEQAIAAEDKMIANFNTAARAGKIRKGLERVSLSDWKGSMTELGIGRIPQGVERARQKMQDFAGDLIAHENTGLSELARMPSVTLEDNINRMVTFARHMATFSR